MIAAILAFAMTVSARQQPPCDLRVHVVDAATDKPLPKIAINLRLGISQDRTTIQHETDATGVACFEIPHLIQGVDVSRRLLNPLPQHPC